MRSNRTIDDGVRNCWEIRWVFGTAQAADGEPPSGRTVNVILAQVTWTRRSFHGYPDIENLSVLP